MWEFFACQIQYGCVRAVICKPAATMKWAVYQVTPFFFQAEQAVLQLVSFRYNFLPQNDQYVKSQFILT